MTLRERIAEIVSASGRKKSRKLESMHPDHKAFWMRIADQIINEIQGHSVDGTIDMEKFK